jgi:hypothetical protein
VEALWALDQPPGKLNPRAMLRDTLALTIRVNLSPAEAYKMIPGRDPKTVKPPNLFGA